ncbi:OFA family MFS transporter [Klebsiella indica]|uniref:OFA family MFS transporter n=1 Tax=Klebsiella indica TaxID=2582917 RepID=A0A5R9LNR2_9ENTR|nr:MULTISPECIES: OFA family MFS transporter [Klebsiella]TLV23005.1 OFA family MFS transporter [Klebsiella indica]
MDYSKKRWRILIASCFINLCVGSMYAWSVFATPMADYLSQLHNANITSADLAIVFVICNSVGPITMISGGKINDTFGPRMVIFTGGLMFGGGMILCGFASQISHLIWAYGILTGLGLGMVYGATISTSIKFFPDKRGFVGGVTTALFGISSVIIPPIAGIITAEAGILSAFKIIGLGFAVIICACAFVIDKCPHGFSPDGWQPPQHARNIMPSGNKTWRQMMSSFNFYLMLIMLTCGAVAGLMCISLASPLAKIMVGMSTAAATLAVSVLALFNVLGRVMAGMISDKIGRINTLMLACILSIPGLSALYYTGIGDDALFYTGISIIGICFGAFMGVFPGFTADQFGAQHNSVNFGIMFCGFAIAGYVGPTIMSSTFAATHSYHSAFPVGIAFSVTALVLALIFRLINKNILLK